MKSLTRVCRLFGIFVIVVALMAASVVHAGPVVLKDRGGQVSWFSAPKGNPNGWYWAYDDSEQDPPFAEPALPPMPAGSYSDYCVHDTAVAEKIAPYNNEPFQYSLPDSFWFYGHWLATGDKLYISPDGWVSFDAASEEGYPDAPGATPPFPNTGAPNMIIAPLWADYDPTRTLGDVDNNRVYYLFNGNLNSLIVEWHQIEGHSSGNEYSFLVMLRLGGQALLQQYENCGVVFSSHLIHFMYNTSSAGWDADGAATGFEDADGLKGITYPNVINTDGDDFQVIRAGYKRIFQHDVEATAVLGPRTMVLRYTPIEVEVVVANVGEETEHFTAEVDIVKTSNLEVVYHHVLGSYDLLPGEKDTLKGPCWEPDELGDKYFVELDVELDRDQCTGNNTLMSYVYVGCEDTLKYHARGVGFRNIWFFNSDTHIAVFFESDGGLLVTGGQVETPFKGNLWVGAAWQADAGCGLPADPPLATVIPEVDTISTFSFAGGGVFIPAASPGNVWVGVIPSASNQWQPFRMTGTTVPPNSSCFMGVNNNRTSYRSFGSWGWANDSRTLNLDVYAHLGFGDYPLPRRPEAPCWEGGLHDLTCSRFQEPAIEYVEDGEPVGIELAVANLGYQAEPDSGFITVKCFITEFAAEDTVFADSTVVSAIGWMGDPEDDPDTMYVPITPWIPEGKCEQMSPIAYYELTGLVRLGKIGPDETDHCPYNDTVRHDVRCLLSHDVGLAGIMVKPPPHRKPDWYEPGTALTIQTAVENFGYHAEDSIEVRCEIRDQDEDNELVWHAIERVEFLDWRGNEIGRPHVTSVVFPPFTTPNQHHMTITCHTEMLGDECPDDDFRVVHINSGIGESSSPARFAFDLQGSGAVRGECSVRFAIPHSCNARIDVIDVGGRKVCTLVDDTYQPGFYNLRWDGADDAGRRVPAGIYLVRMNAEEFSSVRKIVLLK
jgi:hypothetical protein